MTEEEMRAACKRWGLEPVTQTRFGAPDGDCFTACVATLTGVSLAKLEPVYRAHREWAVLYLERQYAASYAARDRCYRALRYFTGVTLAWIPALPYPRLTAAVPLGFAIAGGPSARGVEHAVVTRDGVVIWDPHPDRSGLERIEYFDVLVRVGSDPGDAAAVLS
jgi:hypothetical protein